MPVILFILTILFSFDSFSQEEWLVPLDTTELASEDRPELCNPVVDLKELADLGKDVYELDVVAFYLAKAASLCFSSEMLPSVPDGFKEAQAKFFIDVLGAPSSELEAYQQINRPVYRYRLEVQNRRDFDLKIVLSDAFNSSAYPTVLESFQVEVPAKSRLIISFLSDDEPAVAEEYLLAMGPEGGIFWKLGTMQSTQLIVPYDGAVFYFQPSVELLPLD